MVFDFDLLLLFPELLLALSVVFEGLVFVASDSVPEVLPLLLRRIVADGVNGLLRHHSFELQGRRPLRSSQIFIEKEQRHPLSRIFRFQGVSGAQGRLAQALHEGLVDDW